MNSKADYLNNPWNPVPQEIVKDDELSKTIDSDGYAVRSILSKSQVEQLRQLYNELHNIHQENGGMFYSVYSQNLDYRKQTHEKIGAILTPILESYFKDYRVMLNSFVVKVPGSKSEFYLHQDTTGLDEQKYSPLNLWIPLDHVDPSNGCLGVVPKSHKFFSPYRSISFPAPFDQINTTVKKYLQPISMSQGEALIFDNRVLHNSYVNSSSETRIAVICGLFPKDAKLTTCFKPTYELGGEVELIEHEDDFLLKHPNFLIDCQSRPNTGKSIGWKNDPYYAISEETFEKLCLVNGVIPVADNVSPMGECNLISEPI